MDGVASVLTFLDAVRKGVKLAKKVYDAPRELEELQVEVETFTSVLHDVSGDACELRRASRSFDTSLSMTQACLVSIQQLIEYQLVKEVPEGKKTRRTAWLREVGHVHQLLQKLSECRAGVVLALSCESAVTVRRSETTIRELQRIVHEKSADLSRTLLESRDESHQANNQLIKRLDAAFEQSWEIHRASLEATKTQFEQLETKLARLLSYGHGSTLLPAVGQERIEWSATDTSLGSYTALGAREFTHIRRNTGCSGMVSHSIERSPVGTVNEGHSLPRDSFPCAAVLRVLDACAAGHLGCSSAVDEVKTELPTRVVEVGVEGDEVRCPRLGSRVRADAPCIWASSPQRFSWLVSRSDFWTTPGRWYATIRG
ncbi:hypothetical protein BAUCODRAFT_389880 [Baudoinia panamericana UAMH 10762]|uniref:Fungal N-terminal domain-containing protein n=1 Tax=Baudoinia panamericana (strain UAMH 10762) TaxID=717646 RepID=M2NJ01_BAUPA|nr:uncharacterized protein BAUCODRAFT_389880 [Baudoinia panamericana UAMH 10762]EMC99075.1 hypothetical protein BAUCODRAFT_389880 [Baudoinia panamericana UAMH 10762]